VLTLGTRRAVPVPPIRRRPSLPEWIGKMPRRPYFPFFPADWRGNTKLKFASQAEKSAWLEFMCLGHDSDEYGILRHDLKRIADAIPCHVGALQSLADQDILKGCHKGEAFAGYFHTDKNRIKHTLIEPCRGPIWFSSRMVLDEHLRAVASVSGRRGGNPTLKGGDNPHPKPSYTYPIPSPSPPNAGGMAGKRKEVLQKIGGTK
jgi:hypothetical protein